MTMAEGVIQTKLREALENLQWLDEMLEPGVVTGRCPECESEQKYGHADDCKTGKALAFKKGDAEKQVEALLRLWELISQYDPTFPGLARCQEAGVK